MTADELRRQVVACGRELIRAPSPSGEEGAAAEVVRRWMERLGFDRVWTDEHGSVVGQIEGWASDGPALWFDGHLDTVPVASPELWRHDPFGGEVENGALWGRGAADMKGAVAAMLLAAASIPRGRITGSVTVSASVAEERLEGAALAALIEDRPPDFLVIGEGTRNRVGIGQKGRAGIRVTSRGLCAHSSTPAAGRNAVYAMVAAINKFRSVPLPEDPLLGPALLELTEIVSEPRPSSGLVPDGCTTRWDRRLVRGETADSILATLNAAVEDVEGTTVELEEARFPSYTGSTLTLPADVHVAWDTPAESPLVRAAAAAVGDAGGEADAIVLPYCTNGSVAAARGVPTIILGPTDPTLFHVVDEHALIADLVLGVQIYRLLALDLLQ
ncbi:MAG: M20/M25/M40 family metallo-hydrolase [Candidatus Limnocylindrales bacterium]